MADQYLILNKTTGLKIYEGPKPILIYMPDEQWAKAVNLLGLKLYREVSDEG